MPEIVSQLHPVRLLIVGVSQRIVAGDEGVESVGGRGEDHRDGRVHLGVVDVFVAVLEVRMAG